MNAIDSCNGSLGLADRKQEGLPLERNEEATGGSDEELVGGRGDVGGNGIVWEGGHPLGGLWRKRDKEDKLSNIILNKY